MSSIRKITLLCFCGGLFFIFGVFLALKLLTFGYDYFSADIDTSHEPFESKRSFGLDVASRVIIGDVEKYEDRSVRDAPNYYYFETNNMQPLVSFLGLESCQKIPRLYEESVKQLQSKVKWPFNWESTKIYFSLYKNVQQYSYSADMLLFDGIKVILMIDGIPSKSGNQVENPCSE